MHSHQRFVQGGALLISSLGLLALVADPQSMGPVSYAAVATVLLALALIVRMAYTKAGARPRPQFLTAANAGLAGDRS
jgi:hypothetical protein